MCCNDQFSLFDVIDGNCHGCKWLDEVKSSCQKYGSGSGYCCMIQRSVFFSSVNDKVRRPSSSRCEFFSLGSFADRYNS